MKKLNFSVVALIASVMMLTSCMGDGNSKASYVVYGYIEYDLKVGAPLLYTVPYFGVGLPIYSSALSEYADIGGRTYVQAYAEVEFNIPENQSATQFYYATISNISKIEDFVQSQAWLDTTQIKTNEIPATMYAGASGPINDIMFFKVIFEEYKAYQENIYSLTFDENQEVGKTNSGAPLFDLYLRVVLKSEGKGDVYKNQGPLLAVDIQEIRNRLKHRLEGNYQNGYEYLYFRINTVKEIDQETGEKTGWNTSETFALPVFAETN